MEYLQLPRVEFYQLRVQYESLLLETADPERKIPTAPETSLEERDIVKTTDFSSVVHRIEVDDGERGTRSATFMGWLNEISKGSFGTLTIEQMLPYETSLRNVYQEITYERDGQRVFSSKYDQGKVQSAIRKAFSDKRSFSSREELIPQAASLLNIAHFTSEVKTDKPKAYFPEQSMVQNIILDDQGKLQPPKDIETMIQTLESLGNQEIADSLRRKYSSHPQKNRSFHYLPYHTDSSFEQTFLDEVLRFTEMEERGLEVYYNGDRALTEFKIKCFRNAGKGWSYIGVYTPDFLILQRQDGEIYKAIIVETKGEIYANDPAFREKRAFVESEFIRQNNEKFGYARFEYLYLEDTMSERERLTRTHDSICAFFEV